MARSQQLRSGDLEKVQQLIGECRKLGFDSKSWRIQLMAALRQLVGASVGTGMEAIRQDSGRLKLLGPVSLGWASDKSRQIWEHFVRYEDPCADIVLNGIYQQLRQRNRPLTRTREQILDERTWRMSEHYKEYRKVGQIDSCIYALFPLTTNRREKAFDLIAIHRGPQDQAFGERERRLVQHLHQHLGPLIGVHLASAHEPSISALSGRLQQTLRGLLAGDAENQTAERLELGRATVHQYVQALYRHFGVCNRQQLLARWIRYGPPLELPSHVSGRLRETLEILLNGENEQQIAAGLGLSTSTAHQYVLTLYRRFGVSGRSELMSRWIRFNPAAIDHSAIG